MVNSKYRDCGPGTLGLCFMFETITVNTETVVLVHWDCALCLKPSQ